MNESDLSQAGRCALVVPCYNESKRLQTEEYISFLKRAPANFQLIFVDDGSTDKTLEVLAEVQREAGPAALVRSQKPNAGKAEAVRDGMIFSLDEIGADVVGFWDADLATPLSGIADLLSVLGSMSHIQMVFGARVKLLGRHVERRPERHYLGRVFATVVSNILDLPVYDTQCGAKLFRASSDLREILRDPFLSRWIFDVEIIARFIQRRGAEYVQNAIYEYPLHQWEDIAGSRLKPGDFVKAATEVFEIYYRYLKK